MSGDAGIPSPGWTGIGPLPGVDAVEAARVAVGECPILPFLPELAARGIGADLLGRTTALLVDLPTDISTRGWRLSSAPGRLARRARDLLSRDVDALEEACDRARGAIDASAVVGVVQQGRNEVRASAEAGADERCILRVTGPWTLAASVELPLGRLVLTDSGARRDLSESLLDGLATSALRLACRTSRPARIVLDESRLWEVVAGAVPGPSGFDPVAALPGERIGSSLCRFAAGLRERGVADVLVRVPSLGPGGQRPPWQVLTSADRGERPLDGLVVDSASLVERRPHPEERGPAPDNAAIHASLDAVGTVLSRGGFVQLDGLRSWTGSARPPRSGGEAELGAQALLAMLNAVGAPAATTLGRLVLAPSTFELGGGLAMAVEALAGARLLAETMPRLAE